MYNKILVIVLMFSAYIFEYMCLASISKNKVELSFKSIGTIFLITVLNFAFSISQILLLKTIISFLTFIIICKFLLNENITESIATSIVYLITVVILEFILSLILTNLLSVDGIEYVKSTTIMKGFMTCIMTFIIVIVSQHKIINRMYLKICKMIKDLNVKVVNIYILVLILFILLIFYIVNIVNKLSLGYSIAYISIILVVIFYIFYILYNYHYSKLLNKLLQEKDESYQKLIDEYKLFKHNIRHKFSAIKSAGNEKLKHMVSSYLSEFNNSIDCTNNILSIPSGLRGVIYQKIIERDNIDIEVIVDNYIMTEPMNELSIKSYCNLVESFGIMFDNAIEASECVNNPYIYIYLNEDEKSYIIKCCNKINNDINIDELLEKGRTSKTNHHGVGLYYINKKTNFNLKICVHSDKFSTTIVVRK